MSTERVPEQMAPEVFEVAARLYAQHNQSYSMGDLIAAGSEVQIPQEFVQEALRQVQERHLQEQQQKRQEAKRWNQLKIGAIALVTLLAVWLIWIYNSLSTTIQNIELAWAQVENQLQRRADLIPNLVNVTRASAQQDQELVKLLNQARQSYLSAQTQEEQVTAATQLNQAINVFQAESLQNPAFRNNDLYLGLQDELAGTENRIATERMRYNQIVRDYNNEVHAFPNTLVAPLFGFYPKPYFKADSTEVPSVKP